MIPNNNIFLFLNLINNSGPDFKDREELINIHKKSLQLDLSLKLRKKIEYEFNKLKIEELNEKIDEMKFQKKYIDKRNENILENIQKNNLNSLELASRSNQNLLSINNRKKIYQNYLDSIKPRIQSESKTYLLTKNNIFIIERNNELNKLKQNMNKNNYYEELIRVNEQLAKEIKAMQRKNYSLSLKNQEKEKLFLEKEEKLKNNANKIYLDNKDPNLLQNNENNNNLKDRKKNNYMKEQIILKNENILRPGKSYIQYRLNMNHNFGILDELKQKEIDIINEKIRKEFYREKYERELNESISASSNSLNDLRKQIIDPNKQIIKIPNNNMSNTLNQNFENQNKKENNNFSKNLEDNKSNNNNNVDIQNVKKSQNNIINNTPEGEKIDNNNNNKQFIDNSTYNLLQSKNQNIKASNSNINNINNNQNNTINSNQNNNIDNNQKHIIKISQNNSNNDEINKSQDLYADYDIKEI